MEEGSVDTQPQLTPTPPSQTQPNQPAQVSANAKTILIAEDDQSIRMLLTRTFQNAGYSVIEAGDGVAAIEQALAHHPKAIILDIMMPKMDGLTALKQIRLDSWGKTALVIILTNLTADNRILAGVSESLPSYYFVKSDIEPDQFVAKVTELIDGPV